MRKSNFGDGRRAAGFFRLCLGIIISLTLAMGGMALTPRPVQAAIVFTPLGPQTINAQECVTFTPSAPLTITSACTIPPNALCFPWTQPEYHFFWKASANWPPWLNLDQDTGVLTGCPPVGTVGTPYYTAEIGCTSQLNPFDQWCVIPCQEQTPAAGPHAQVIINIVAAAAVCTLAIDPTFYPVAWENMPFSTTLIATGGVGPFSWSATGLPAGLTVDPLTGIISGTPAPGTCGPYTVTVTVTDLGTCPTTPGCCPDVIRPFTLIVDCYANYPIITYFTYTACDFNVAIGPGLTVGQTQVLIDGTQEAILGANQSETFTSYPCESHLVMVNQTIAGPDPNTSFEVIGSNLKMVNDIDNYAYFDYAQKVRIETGSEPTGISQPRGTGWYAIGDYFSTTTASPVNSDNQKGIKYIFRAWGLPDGSTNPNRDLVFTVNKAGAATALYDTYYLLQLKSDYPYVVDERSWELKDTTATYSLALQPVPMLGFWGGLGAKLRPINGKGSIPMNEPQVVEIRWKKDCTIPAIIMSVLALVVIGLVYNFGFRRRHPVAELATTPAKTKAPAKAKPVAKSGFCPKCGNRVRKDEDFCKKCGKKLK